MKGKIIAPSQSNFSYGNVDPKFPRPDYYKVNRTPTLFNYPPKHTTQPQDCLRRESQKKCSKEDFIQSKSLNNLGKTLNSLCERVKGEVQDRVNKPSKCMTGFDFLEKMKSQRETRTQQGGYSERKVTIPLQLARKTCSSITKLVSPAQSFKSMSTETEPWGTPHLSQRSSSFIHVNPENRQQVRNKVPKASATDIGGRYNNLKQLIPSADYFGTPRQENKLRRSQQKPHSPGLRSPSNKSHDSNQCREETHASYDPKKMEEMIEEGSTIDISTANLESRKPIVLQRSRISKHALPVWQQPKRFQEDDFYIIKQLGRGIFGQVLLAIHRETNLVVALKKIYKEKVRHYKMGRQIHDQIRIHLSLNHPNIVKMYGVFEEESYIYLVLEYVMGCSLFDLLNQKEKLTVCETLKVLKGVVEGIHYMHDKFIAHRDIKPENILISEAGVVKICDMGWSAVITTSRKTYCGTFDYVPPQILQRKNYDLSVDIWCLGALTYELLLGHMPYEGDHRTVISKKIASAKLQFSDEIPREARDFIEMLVRKDPGQRPKCREILKHSFFSLCSKY